MNALALATAWVVLAAEHDQEKSLVIAVECDEDHAAQQLAAEATVQLGARGWTVVRERRGTCWLAERAAANVALARAREAFENLRLEQARDELARAAHLFTEAGSLLGAPELFAEVQMLRGWTALELGLDAEASAAFTALSVAAPRWSPSPARYPPPVIAAYEAAARRAQARRGELTVASEPARPAVTGIVPSAELLLMSDGERGALTVSVSGPARPPTSPPPVDGDPVEAARRLAAWLDDAQRAAASAAVSESPAWWRQPAVWGVAAAAVGGAVAAVLVTREIRHERDARWVIIPP